MTQLVRFIEDTAGKYHEFGIVELRDGKVVELGVSPSLGMRAWLEQELTSNPNKQSGEMRLDVRSFYRFEKLNIVL